MLRTLFFLFGLLWCMPNYAETTTVVEEDDEPVLVDIHDSVITIPAQAGVSFDDVVDSVKLKANLLNMTQVGHLKLHEGYKALNLEGQHKRTEILQLCDVAVAKQMLDFDINFLAYMPCRIGIIEDKDNKIWLVTTNLNILISASNLPPHLEKIALEVRDNIEKIMEAGASGDL